jgi:chemotaxis protein MotB
LNSPDQHQEIIIIKRSGEGEHGHHGGAWKIAFADFMTAMMALFLVLWLINAADQETKKAVASYFNPVKLVERDRSEKGLHDIEGVQDEKADNPNGQFPESTPAEDPPEQEITDVELFADPFAVLDVIASNHEPSDTKNVQEGGGREGNDAINDAAGGEAFMDPFSPNFWNEEVRNSNNSGQLTGRYETEGQGETKEDQLAAAPGFGSGEGVERPVEKPSEEDVEAGPGAGAVSLSDQEGEADMETAAIGEGPQSAVEQMSEVYQPEAPVEEAVAMDEEETAAQERAAVVENAAAEMLEQISEQLKEALGGDSELVGELSVTPSGDEILISLTDAFDISMFEVGSALPSTDLVVALEKIGGVLAEQPGGVRIHGHTDARPFRSKDYDNWRLSSARAQSAYYMLLRGGLEETRVAEISGFADRKLLDEEDPLSHRNRRIEVLVEVPEE